MPTVEGLARRYWRLKRLDDPLSTNRIGILLNSGGITPAIDRDHDDVLRPHTDAVARFMNLWR